MNMKVKYKLLSEYAKEPIKAHSTDAGYDLYASWVALQGYNEEEGAVSLVCHSDVAFEIPEGYVGLLFPRSSIAKTGLLMTNGVGVIDAGYRGEVMAKFKIINPEAHYYSPGDRFAQLVIIPIPSIELECADELEDSDRGAGGYGSSGN